MASPARNSAGFGSRTWILFAVIAGGLLLYSALTARGGVPDPTDTEHLSRGTVVFDSAVLVLREGLEAILVLAAVLAGLRGANAADAPPGRARRRRLDARDPVATWFAAVWVLGQLGGGGLAVQAATGLLAVIVLMIVMNWFGTACTGPAG